MFWLTKENFVEAYPNNVNFTHFSLEHFIVLGICIAVVLAGALLYRRLDEKNRVKFINILAIFLVANEIVKDVICIATNQWSAERLPFHLCSINIFICCWYAIHPNKLAAEVLYATCLPGAFIALGMPTWHALPHWNFMSIHSTTVHIGLVMMPAALLAGGFRPNFRRLPKVFAILMAEAVPIYFFNKVFDTNFFFLNGTSGNPLLKVLVSLLGEDLYILALPVLLAVVWFFMYFPWELAERKKTKANSR